MVRHENWVKTVMAVLTGYMWKHRILLYIAVVVTLTLAVELFHISFVGR